MTGEILSLYADHLPEPFHDSRIVYVIIVDPFLVACVIWRINIDALNLSLIPGQQGFQRVQIISVDDHVLAAVVLFVLSVLIIAVLALQHPIRYIQMMIDNFIFSDPFKCRH